MDRFVASPSPNTLDASTDAVPIIGTSELAELRKELMQLYEQSRDQQRRAGENMKTIKRLFSMTVPQGLEDDRVETQSREVEGSSSDGAACVSLASRIHLDGQTPADAIKAKARRIDEDRSRENVIGSKTESESERGTE